MRKRQWGGQVVELAQGPGLELQLDLLQLIFTASVPLTRIGTTSYRTSSTSTKSVFPPQLAHLSVKAGT